MWRQVCNAPTGLAIAWNTGCLLPSTRAAKASPLLMSIWQEEPGRQLERLNCPVYSQPIQRPPASPGWAGLPCHQEGSCVCSSRRSASTHVFGQSISGHLSASVDAVWGALLGVTLWHTLHLWCEPSHMVFISHLHGVSHQPSHLSPFSGVVPCNEHFFFASVSTQDGLMEGTERPAAACGTQSHVARHICEGLADAMGLAGRGRSHLQHIALVSPQLEEMTPCMWLSTWLVMYDSLGQLTTWLQDPLVWHMG